MSNEWIEFWQDHPEYGKALNLSGYKKSTQRMIDSCPADIDSFCELGIGNGRNVSMFHDSFPDWEYRANDIYPNIKEIIKNHYPSVLEFAQIDIADSLQYLKTCLPADIFFTHGHMTHIAPDRIGELCKLVSEKANKYIYLFEPLPSGPDGEKVKKRCARYERVYHNLFPGFVPYLCWMEWTDDHPYRYGIWLLKKFPDWWRDE